MSSRIGGHNMWKLKVFVYVIYFRQIIFLRFNNSHPSFDY